MAFMGTAGGADGIRAGRCMLRDGLSLPDPDSS